MPDSLADIARRGDRLATLEALRDRLAAEIDRCVEATELSSLALRFQRTLEQIHELGGGAHEEESDDLAARRDAKLRAATGS